MNRIFLLLSLLTFSVCNNASDITLYMSDWKAQIRAYDDEKLAWMIQSVEDTIKDSMSDVVYRTRKGQKKNAKESQDYADMYMAILGLLREEEARRLL